MFVNFLLATTLTDVLQNGLEDAQKVSEAWDNNWNMVFGGGSVGGQTLYAAITNLGLLFALGALVVSGMRMFKAINEMRPIDKVAIFWAVLAISLLASNGTLLAAMVLQLRAIVNQASEQVIAGTLAGVKMDEVFKQLQGKLFFKDMIEGFYKPCLSMQGPEQITCLERAATTADTVADSLRTVFGPLAWINSIIDRFKDAGAAFQNGNSFSLMGMFTPIWQPIVYSILYWAMQAYQHLLEAVLLVVSLMSPLAVGGSLFSFGINSIVAWLTGFFSVAMAKICFNMLVGLAAVTATNSGVNDPGWFPLFIGIFAPFISFSLASGSGLVVWMSFTSIAGNVASAGATVVSGVPVNSAAPASATAEG